MKNFFICGLFNKDAQGLPCPVWTAQSLIRSASTRSTHQGQALHAPEARKCWSRRRPQLTAPAGHGGGSAGRAGKVSCLTAQKHDSGKGNASLSANDSSRLVVCEKELKA